MVAKGELLGISEPKDDGDWGTGDSAGRPLLQRKPPRTERAWVAESPVAGRAYGVGIPRLYLAFNACAAA